MLSLLLMIISVVTISSMVVVTFSERPIHAAEAALSERGLFLVGAGVAAGLACCGAGIGLGTASAAAIGAISEKPEMLRRTLLFAVLIEAIAIYGLAMFFIIYSRT
jgi:F0F1-type ATP synthase membrane subunit c/vacuolar-type H+-ATPase subunit K